MFNEMGAALRKAGRQLVVTDKGNVEKKEGLHNYVTDADLRMQELIYELMHGIDGNAKFVGEEGETDKVGPGERYFLVDPIDGTTNFIHGMGLSCLAAAYCEDNDVLAAAVYNPYTDELYTAGKGKGAYLNGRRICVSHRPLRDGLVAMGAGGGRREDSIRHVLPLYKYCFMNTRGVRGIGSAELAICYVAAGRLDAYTEFKLMPWDYAAGGLILTEAGGVITDLYGKELPLSTPSGIIAGNREAYEDLKRMIEENRASE